MPVPVTCEWIVPCAQVKRTHSGGISLLGVMCGPQTIDGLPFEVKFDIAFCVRGEPKAEHRYALSISPEDRADDPVIRTGTVTLPHADLIVSTETLEPGALNAAGRYRLELALDDAATPSGAATMLVIRDGLA